MPRVPKNFRPVIQKTFIFLFGLITKISFITFFIFCILDPVQAETEETPMELKERDTVDTTATAGTVSLTNDHDTGNIDDQIEMDTVSPIDKEIRRRSTSAKEDSSDCSACMKKTFSGFLILIRGWKTYMKYSVAYAGLGLALLYMTVLGFDNITVGKSNLCFMSSN